MIIVLSGPVHGGKTTFLEQSLGRWTSRGLALSGFLSIAVSNPAGEPEYDLLDLKEGRRLPYLRRAGEAGWERTGPYYFVPATLDLARSLVAGAGPEELLIVDEVGPLELAGGGLWTALQNVIFRPEGRALLVVREEILEDFVVRLGSHAPLIFDVRDPNIRLLIDGTIFGSQKPHDGQS